ncbi:MAG: hypothetical protein ACTHJ8_10175 [Mucilaginibacter sp.]|jgi:hypothetical protein
MKKLVPILLVTIITLPITACHFGRHTTIVEKSNNHYLRIESTGKVYFNNEQTAIIHISSGGYLKYQDDENKLMAENDGRGGIKYDLTAGDEKLDPNGNGKQFIADAIKIMIKKGYHSN